MDPGNIVPGNIQKVPGSNQKVPGSILKSPRKIPGNIFVDEYQLFEIIAWADINGSLFTRTSFQGNLFS